MRLWDDRALYEEQSARARREALRWHPDRVRPLYAGFFRDVRLRPGPPAVSSAAGMIATGDGRTMKSGSRRTIMIPARKILT